jgi:UDP-3-O-[3-hydroxymyristoyl] N-acetylglucosamine deacetylase
MNQRTLEQPIGCEGIGLHSGAPVRLLLRPAAADTGVVFVRTDLERPVVIPARTEFVVDTSLATTIGKEGVRVGTVEHLMSALAGLGIDNVRIELDGPEVPIMDGSAAPFARMIEEAGIREQEESRTYLVVKKTVTVRDGDKEATLSPGRGFSVDCSIDFRHPLISGQRLSSSIAPADFARDIAGARTFGFLKDVERLKQAGLACGGSLENAIVVDEFSILNPEGLRFPDEFVRHKLLDAVGDMALAGHAVVGHLKVSKSGHAMHHALLRQLSQDASAYELVRARSHNAERMGRGVEASLLEQMVA